MKQVLETIGVILLLLWVFRIALHETLPSISWLANYKLSASHFNGCRNKTHNKTMDGNII